MRQTTPNVHAWHAGPVEAFNRNLLSSSGQQPRHILQSLPPCEAIEPIPRNPGEAPEGAGDMSGNGRYRIRIFAEVGGQQHRLSELVAAIAAPSAPHSRMASRVGVEVAIPRPTRILLAWAQGHPDDAGKVRRRDGRNVQRVGHAGLRYPPQEDRPDMAVCLLLAGTEAVSLQRDFGEIEIDRFTSRSSRKPDQRSCPIRVEA